MFNLVRKSHVRMSKFKAGTASWEKFKSSGGRKQNYTQYKQNNKG